MNIDVQTLLIEMAKAKIKIKVSDSGIVTLAASGDGYATLNALVEVLAATICEASPNWDFAEIMTDAAVNRMTWLMTAPGRR